MTGQPRLLTDEQMQAFIVNGYVTVKTDFPAHVHADICNQATTIFETTGNPANAIYPQIPQLADIFAHPAVHGGLTSILGPNYIMHPHRHCHLTPPGKAPQNYHKDSYEADENVHHHRTRWAMAFYYPQDVPLALGPTAVRPATQYYNTQTQAEREAELLVTGQAGTVTLVHYDLWHRASANLSDKSRFMMKFLFCRMEEPQTPSWQTSGTPWRTPTAANALRHPHPQLWQHLWDWHRGVHQQPTPQASTDQMPLTDWLRALRDDTEAVRLDAIYALGAAGAPVVPALLALLYQEAEVVCATNLRTKHTNPSELAAGYALAAVGAPAVPALIDALHAPAWSVRASAADILGDIGQPAQAAVPGLSQLLQDESVWVRRNAVEALGTMGQVAAPAVPALTQTLRYDEDDRVRHNAALALARIGPKAQAAIPALQAVQADTNLYVRENSAIALQRILSN